MASVDYQAISIEEEEQLLQGEGRVRVTLDCFSILCGVVATVVLLFLVAVIVYYFFTPSIAIKK